jgi:hypothetical protein
MALAASQGLRTPIVAPHLSGRKNVRVCTTTLTVKTGMELPPVRGRQGGPVQATEDEYEFAGERRARHFTRQGNRYSNKINKSQMSGTEQKHLSLSSRDVVKGD